MGACFHSLLSLSLLSLSSPLHTLFTSPFRLLRKASQVRRWKAGLARSPASAAAASKAAALCGGR